MNVFISWSGELSRKIAEEFRIWLPKVIQAVKPRISSKDTEKGTRWFGEIAQKLDDADVGIICLTRDNTQNPWLLFESGVISKIQKKGYVCTVLFDLDHSEVTGPLAHFQHTNFEKDDIFQLLQTINNQLEEKKLSDELLASVFEVWWPELKGKIAKARVLTGRLK